MKNVKKSLKGSLTEEKLEAIKKDIAESLSRDRHFLICAFPFTGSIAMRFNLVPVRDKRLRTAATDGTNVFFDCDFYLKLNKDERIFVLAHEIWHCVMLHLARKQTRNQQLFNIAADMEVNHLLSTTESVNKAKLIAPQDVLFPPTKLEGKSAEVIYDYLLKQLKNKAKKDKCSSDSSDSADSSSTNQNNDQPNQSSDSTNGNSNNNNKNKSKGLSGQFDKHTYVNDTDEDDEEYEINDQWGEVGYDDDYRPEVREDIAERMREAAVAAAQQYEREHGTLPAGVKNLLNKIGKPEISWQEVLAQFVSSCYNGKRRWLPPNRRHVYNDMYFQSRRNETINVIVAIDTSGSCIRDLPKFFGELNGLVNSFGSYTLHVIQCDAAVAKYDVYDDNNPFDISESDNIEWAGGGGTSFTPVFKFVEKEGIHADCLIYLTDGYGDVQNTAPLYPVLWLLTKDGSADFCNWGRKIRFKKAGYDY